MPHEIAEARIGTQGVESRINFEPRQKGIVLVVSLLKPGEGLLSIAEGGVN